MFHKVKNVSPLPDFKLSVQFCEGVTKLYDVKPLFERLPVFASLKEHPEIMDKLEGQLLDQIKNDGKQEKEPEIPEEDISAIMDLFVDEDGVVIEE